METSNKIQRKDLIDTTSG